LTDTNRYPANVFWSDEDEGFIAVASDLPGCSAFGETQHEALTELQSAIAAWIEAARAAGNPIPEPSQPALDNFYSGKILVRMPKSLHGQLAQGAKTEAVSLNQHIVFLLTWAATHRTLMPDWTTAVGPTYYGPATIITWGGPFTFSVPQGRQTVAWSALPTEPTAILIPQKALALSRRTS
jgi:antitoxin HicB